MYKKKTRTKCELVKETLSVRNTESIWRQKKSRITQSRISFFVLSQENSTYQRDRLVVDQQSTRVRSEVCRHGEHVLLDHTNLKYLREFDSMPEFSMCKLDKQDELFFVVTKRKSIDSNH